jgi:hypothetical protein
MFKVATGHVVRCPFISTVPGVLLAQRACVLSMLAVCWALRRQRNWVVAPRAELRAAADEEGGLCLEVNWIE